jgi:hypothetical protein
MIYVDSWHLHALHEYCADSYSLIVTGMQSFNRAFKGVGYSPSS